MTFFVMSRSLKTGNEISCRNFATVNEALDWARRVNDTHVDQSAR